MNQTEAAHLLHALALSHYAYDKVVYYDKHRAHFTENNADTVDESGDGDDATSHSKVKSKRSSLTFQSRSAALALVPNSV